MKESVLDVLMYLFEHYLDEDDDVEADQEALARELVQAGFERPQVTKALGWLEALSDGQSDPAGRSRKATGSVRVYSDHEADRLDVQCRGFILFLEQVGVLDEVMRERVIDRAMALEEEDLGLERLKWVVLMVLFNHPGGEAAAHWMQGLVFDESGAGMH